MKKFVSFVTKFIDAKWTVFCLKYEFQRNFTKHLLTLSDLYHWLSLLKLTVAYEHEMEFGISYHSGHKVL